MAGPVALAPFGRTGHASARVIFGAAGLGSMSQERADATLAVLADYGVNHIDTARSYGESELRLAPYLARHRHDVFLATKTGERRADGARRELEESLGRLGVDRVDLIQLHNLVEVDEWETAHAPGGALEALLSARDEGLVRFIGVTGHGLRIPSMHLRSLDRHPYDSVLFPYNAALLADPGYAADVARLVEVCTERGVAMQTIKSVARRRWAADHRGPQYSWYEPLPPGPALERAVQVVLAQPGLFLNSSSDARLLRPILDAAVAGVGGPAPRALDLQADATMWAIRPLFDGADLERI